MDHEIEKEWSDLLQKYRRIQAISNQEILAKKIASLEAFWTQEGGNHASYLAEDTISQQKQLAFYKKQYEIYQQLDRNIADLQELSHWLEAEREKNMEDFFLELLAKTREILNEEEVKLLLNQEYDANACYISLNSGAGGTESQDWVSMLMRMYTRYAERNEFQCEIMDQNPGEEAGFKSVTLFIQGMYAYGYLKAETGIHRLVRISPFDANHKRHTSFASVMVTPEIEDTQSIEISPQDLRIDTYRASGAGGQHVNKTDSAVRVVYLPLNIVVTCQQERSQHKNRERAMKILYSRLAQIREEEKIANLQQVQGIKKENAFGSQIRSYILHPYEMVKDNRTKIQTSQAQKVLDGDLHEFIFGYLRCSSI